MCFIQMADANPTRPGKPPRRPEEDPEQERVEQMFGLGAGRDLMGTIAAARRALQQPDVVSPTRVAKRTVTTPKARLPGLPTIGGR